VTIKEALAGLLNKGDLPTFLIPSFLELPQQIINTRQSTKNILISVTGGRIGSKRLKLNSSDVLSKAGQRLED